MKKTSARTADSLWHVTPPVTSLKTTVFDVLSSNVVNQRSGRAKPFFRLEFPGWVNIIAETEHDEILLIRQYRFGTGRVEVEIPGGAVDDNESPLVAGLRELQEETGYAGENARIIGQVCPNPAIQDNICSTVLVERVKKICDPRLDDMEEIEVFTTPVEKVFAMVADGTIDHGLVLNGLMFYAMARQRRL